MAPNTYVIPIIGPLEPKKNKNSVSSVQTIPTVTNIPTAKGKTIPIVENISTEKTKSEKSKVETSSSSRGSGFSANSQTSSDTSRGGGFSNNPRGGGFSRSSLGLRRIGYFLPQIKFQSVIALLPPTVSMPHKKTYLCLSPVKNLLMMFWRTTQKYTRISLIPTK